MNMPYQLWRSPEGGDIKKCGFNFTFSLAGEWGVGYGVPDLPGG